MTRRDLLSLMCFGFEGIEVPDYLQSLLGQGLGGVILFKRNLQDLAQICTLINDLHRYAAGHLLVGVDQEGGRVTRLPAPFLAPPPAAVLGRIDDPRLAMELAQAIGRELHAAGFNWNLTPVLDVHTNPENPIIGDRAFSPDPHRVARMGLAVCRGFESVGIVTTGKHFPGHGETAADSHLTLPESPQPAARWREVEFVPFREAIRAGIPSILIAHLACPALDPNAPSSLSSVLITQILRGELGFRGMVVSDDLEMGAITARFDIGEAAVRFLEAGGDLILICRNADRQHEALAAVESALQGGRLSEAQLEASLHRVAQVRRRLHPAQRPSGLGQEVPIIGASAHRELVEQILARATARTRAPEATS